MTLPSPPFADAALAQQLVAMIPLPPCVHVGLAQIPMVHCSSSCPQFVTAGAPATLDSHPREFIECVLAVPSQNAVFIATSLRFLFLGLTRNEKLDSSKFFSSILGPSSSACVCEAVPSVSSEPSSHSSSSIAASSSSSFSPSSSLAVDSSSSSSSSLTLPVPVPSPPSTAPSPLISLPPHIVDSIFSQITAFTTLTPSSFASNVTLATSPVSLSPSSSSVSSLSLHLSFSVSRCRIASVKVEDTTVILLGKFAPSGSRLNLSDIQSIGDASDPDHEYYTIPCESVAEAQSFACRISPFIHYPRRLFFSHCVLISVFWISHSFILLFRS